MIGNILAYTKHEDGAVTVRPAVGEHAFMGLAPFTLPGDQTSVARTMDLILARLDQAFGENGPRVALPNIVVMEDKGFDLLRSGWPKAIFSDLAGGRQDLDFLHAMYDDDMPDEFLRKPDPAEDLMIWSDPINCTMVMASIAPDGQMRILGFEQEGPVACKGGYLVLEWVRPLPGATMSLPAVLKDVLDKAEWIVTHPVRDAFWTAFWREIAATLPDPMFRQAPCEFGLAGALPLEDTFDSRHYNLPPAAPEFTSGSLAELGRLIGDILLLVLEPDGEPGNVSSWPGVSVRAGGADGMVNLHYVDQDQEKMVWIKKGIEALVAEMQPRGTEGDFALFASRIKQVPVFLSYFASVESLMNLTGHERIAAASRLREFFERHAWSDARFAGAFPWFGAQ